MDNGWRSAAVARDAGVRSRPRRSGPAGPDRARGLGEEQSTRRRRTRQIGRLFFFFFLVIPVRLTLLYGLRVYYSKSQGLFRKNSDDVSPEALIALLVTSKRTRAVQRDDKIVPSNQTDENVIRTIVILIYKVYQLKHLDYSTNKLDISSLCLNVHASLQRKRMKITVFFRTVLKLLVV